LQAPVMRLSIDQALQYLPALQRAAEALGRIDAPPAKTSKAQR
jgi:IclR family acetate operon transcriptional repressor